MISPTRRVAAPCAAAILLLGAPAVAQVGSGVAFETPAYAAVEAGGTLVVTDPVLGAVVRLDPSTGDRTVVSGPPAGAGPNLVFPVGIAVESPSGDLIVVDIGQNALVRIDATSGSRTIISSQTIGAGPSFLAPMGIAIEASGDFVVTDLALAAVVRVEPATGSRTILSDATTGIGEALVTPNGIGVQPSGDIVVADVGALAILRVNATTGDRTILSQSAEDPADAIGTGPSMEGPIAIAVEPGGNLVVSDTDSRSVLRVASGSGDRTVLSGPRTGVGPDFRPYFGLAIGAGGDVLFTDADLAAVLRIDGSTGDREIVAISIPSTLLASPNGVALEASGDYVVVDSALNLVARVDPAVADCTILSGAGAGSGPPLVFPYAVGVEASDDLVVTDPGLPGVVRVDPTDGARTVVSSGAVGSGTALQNPTGVAVDPSTGDLLVADADLDAVVRIDPATGNRTVVSGMGTGSGPAFVYPSGIAVEATTAIVVGDPGASAIVRVDPSTGNRTIVSDDAIGTGPNGTPTGVAIDGQGFVVSTDPELEAVVRLNPLTVTRTVVSGTNPSPDADVDTDDEVIGTGPSLTVQFGVAVEASSGTIVVTDPLADTVVQVDPTTGDRTSIACASAATQTVLGDTLKVKSGNRPAGRKIVARAKEKSSANTIVGDPTADGASLLVVANGGSSTTQTFSLPQGTDAKGRPFWKATKSGFAYRDRDGAQGPVQQVEISASGGAFAISAELDGRFGTIDVLPPAPGTDGGFVLTIGGGDRYCVNFGAGAEMKNKKAKVWQAKDAQQGACPVEH